MSITEDQQRRLEWLRNVGIRRFAVPLHAYSPYPLSAQSTLPPEPSPAEDAVAVAVAVSSLFPLSDVPLSLSTSTLQLDPSHTPSSPLIFDPPSPRLPISSLSLQLLCAHERSSTARYAGDLTGLHAWPISAFLCSFLSAYPQLVRGRCVLEVGSGSGLVGVFTAAHLAPQRCILSDVNEDALLLCTLNAHINGLQRKVDVVPLPWGDEEAALLSRFPAGFPVILASDCMYKLSTLDALFETVELLLARASTPSAEPPVFIHAFQPRFGEVTAHLLTVAHRYRFSLFAAVDAASDSAAIPYHHRLHGLRVRRIDSPEQLAALRLSIHLFVRDDSYK